MTDLEIARECGATSYSPPPLRAVRGLSFTFDQLTAFADRIRAQQREADVKTCEAERVDYATTGDATDAAYNLAIDHCTAAIRSPAADAPTGDGKRLS